MKSDGKESNDLREFHHFFDLLTVVWHKKSLIFLITLVSILLTALVNFFFLPEIYRNTVLLKRPTIDIIDEKGFLSKKILLSQEETFDLLDQVYFIGLDIDNIKITSIESIPASEHYIKASILYKNSKARSPVDLNKKIITYLNGSETLRIKRKNLETEFFSEREKLKNKIQGKIEREIEKSRRLLKLFIEEKEALRTRITAIEKVQKELAAREISYNDFLRTNPCIFLILDKAGKDRRRLLEVHRLIENEKSFLEKEKDLFKGVTSRQKETISKQKPAITGFEIVESQNNTNSLYKPFRLKNISLSGLIALFLSYVFVIFSELNKEKRNSLEE